MDRATFEKIVGGGGKLDDDLEICWEGGDQWEGPKIRLCVFDADVSSVILENLTSFRLRCLLHGLGIKCDWDEPVTFERLMELEGAVNVNKEFESITFANPYQELRFSKKLMHDNREEWFCTASSEAFFLVTTMRQVHLLLEAAGVGR